MSSSRTYNINSINYNLIILNMMKNRLLVVSAAIALLLLGQVHAHRAAEDEENQA